MFPHWNTALKTARYRDTSPVGAGGAGSCPPLAKFIGPTWGPPGSCRPQMGPTNRANMGPTWVLSAPDGPHVGPMNHAIRVGITTSDDGAGTTSSGGLHSMHAINASPPRVTRNLHYVQYQYLGDTTFIEVIKWLIKLHQCNVCATCVNSHVFRIYTLSDR